MMVRENDRKRLTVVAVDSWVSGAREATTSIRAPLTHSRWCMVRERPLKDVRKGATISRQEKGRRNDGVTILPPGCPVSGVSRTVRLVRAEVSLKTDMVSTSERGRPSNASDAIAQEERDRKFSRG